MDYRVQHQCNVDDEEGKDDTVSANVMISVQKMSESGQMVF